MWSQIPPLIFLRFLHDASPLSLSLSLSLTYSFSDIHFLPPASVSTDPRYLNRSTCSRELPSLTFIVSSANSPAPQSSSHSISIRQHPVLPAMPRFSLLYIFICFCHHLQSSANNNSHNSSFLISSLNTFNSDPWCNPASTSNLRLFQNTVTTVVLVQLYISCIILTILTKNFICHFIYEKHMNRNIFIYKNFIPHMKRECIHI